jgi:hypothetical protein
MDDLDLDDILAGLRDTAYAPHHVMLLQLLANRVCEDSFLLPVEEQEANVRKVASYGFENFRQVASKSAEEIDLLLTVLSNMTQPEPVSEIYLNVLQQEADSMSQFKCMINFYLSISRPPVAEQFLTDVVDEEGNCAVIDPFQKMGYLLCNLSRLTDGRRILLDRKPPSYFPYLLQQVLSPIYMIYQFSYYPLSG